MKPIDQMSDQEICLAAAVEVMGWNVRKGIYFHKTENEKVIRDGNVSDWNPLEKIDQCWMMLNKLRIHGMDIKLELFNDINRCFIGSQYGGDWIVITADKSEIRSICLACLKITNWLKDSDHGQKQILEG